MNERIAIGTAQFGMRYGIANKSGQPDTFEVTEILKEAQRNGIKSLDTAINYGQSEEILGRISVDNWDVITKLPAIDPSYRDIEKWVLNSVDHSLKRLRIGCLYGLLLHRTNDLLDKKTGPKIFKALQLLKQQGKVVKVGVSVYAPEEISHILNHYEVDIIQAPFNLFDRRLVSSGLLKHLKSIDIEVHTRSVFLQGLLLMEQFDRPERFKNWKNLFDSWNQWLDSTSISPLEACLGYVMSFSEIDRVVIGIDNLHQLKEICQIKYKKKLHFPANLQSDDIQLINPSNWS